MDESSEEEREKLSGWASQTSQPTMHTSRGFGVLCFRSPAHRTRSLHVCLLHLSKCAQWLQATPQVLPQLLSRAPRWYLETQEDKGEGSSMQYGAPNAVWGSGLWMWKSSLFCVWRGVN